MRTFGQHLQSQPHIDMARLEEAYYRVPVVTTAQLAEMVRMMEVFARYLSNAWKRLEIMSEFQQMRERELALDRRELVEKLLSGQAGNAASVHLENLRVLARNVGLERFPDRVMVLRLHEATAEGAESVEEPHSAALPVGKEIATQLTLARVAHMIEDRCRNWPNTLAGCRDPGRDVHLYRAEIAHAEPRTAAAG